MRRLALSVITTVLIGLSSPFAIGQSPRELAPTLPDDATVKFDKALLAFHANQLDKCLDELKTLKAQHQMLPPPRLMLARMYLSQGKGANAKPQMELAATENPNDPEVYFSFGVVALLEGRLTDASALLEKAALLNKPTSWSAEQKERLQIELTTGRALIGENRRDWRDADRWLTQLVELAPNARTLERLARARLRQGKVESAVEQLRRAKGIDPKREPVEVTLATFYSESGKPDKSREVLEKAHAANPQDPRLARELAAVYMILGEDEKSYTMIKRAEQLGDDSRTRKLTTAMLARRLGKNDEAIATLEAIRREAPTDFESANQLALVMVELPGVTKKEAAIRLAESNARLHPKRSEALSTLGWVYFRNGRLAEAENMLRASTRTANFRTETAYFLARVLTHVGKTADAEIAKKTLRTMMTEPRLFVMRPEAEAWLAENPSPVGPAPR